MEIEDLKQKKVAELKEIAAVLKIEGAAKMKKQELLDTLIALHEEAKQAGAIEEEQKKETAIRGILRTDQAGKGKSRRKGASRSAEDH